MRLIHHPEKKLLHNESGFTLLEIIAVLVILSILAVVAIPRYFDLQNQARQNAMQTALAEGLGRVNGYFAQQVLSGSTPTQIDYANPANLGTNLGDDFQLSVSSAGAPGTAPFQITVTGRAAAVAGLTISATVQRPGI